MGRFGAAVRVTLCLGAAHLAQELVLWASFDAFGDCFQVQAMGEVDDGLDQLRITVVGAQPGHEALVDLDDIEGEAPQVAEAGPPRTEVVEGEGDAEVLQFVEAAPGARPGGYESGLGDLDAHVFWSQVIGSQDLLHTAYEVVGAELAGRDIYSDVATAAPGRSPTGLLSTSQV